MAAMAPKSFLFLVLVVGLISHYGVEGRVFTKTQQEEDQDLERQLQILNKPPLKTIKAENNDIFDCVDIHKQPALDHPLLNNHKIQMKPSSFPEGYSSEVKASVASRKNVIKHLDCREGTIPIRRTTKEDLIRSKSFFETYQPSRTIHPNSNALGVLGLHVAIHRSLTGNKTFHGVYGDLNVANPKVENDQFSAGLLWVSKSEGTQFLQAGWAVSPQLFGDNRTRIFVYSNSTSPEGCYNLQCKGFVQVDKDITVGVELSPISVYGGKQYGITFMIFQDKVTGDWWLNDISNGNKNVGYWPKEIFSQLQKGASHVAWGGLSRSGLDGQGTSPPMGNGEFPSKDRKACHVTQMQIIDESYALVEPSEESGGYEDFVDNKETRCYDIEYDGNTEGPKGYSMLFGGPGWLDCGI